MPSKYDAILGLIPTALGIGGGGHVIGLDLAIVGGGTIALAIMAYGMFVDPPRNPALGPHQ